LLNDFKRSRGWEDKMRGCVEVAWHLKDGMEISDGDIKTLLALLKEGTVLDNDRDLLTAHSFLRSSTAHLAVTLQLSEAVIDLP